jgi:hypothetical protein
MICFRIFEFPGCDFKAEKGYAKLQRPATFLLLIRLPYGLEQTRAQARDYRDYKDDKTSGD